MNPQLDIYYQNNGRKIKKMVDKILVQFGGLSQKDTDDFYSVANETFVNVLRSYDSNQNFDTFLYSCIKRKIMTEMTRRNRLKRKADMKTVSIDCNSTDNHVDTIQDIASDFDVWNEVMKHNGHSRKMDMYLERLSKLQRKVLFLMAEKYKAEEIERILNITHQQFTDSVTEIRSYENVSILL